MSWRSSRPSCPAGSIRSSTSGCAGVCTAPFRTAAMWPTPPTATEKRPSTAVLLWRSMSRRPNLSVSCTSSMPVAAAASPWPIRSTPWGHAHTGPAPSPETAWRPSSATPPISGRSSGTRGHISGKAARAARSTSQSAIPGKNGPSPTDSIRLLWSRRCTTRYRISWPADTALPTRTVPQRAHWPVWSSAPTAAATCSA